MKMEVGWSSDMSVSYHITTQHHNPEDLKVSTGKLFKKNEIIQ